MRMEMETLKGILPKMAQMISTKLVEIQSINEAMKIPNIESLLQTFSEQGNKVVEIRMMEMTNRVRLLCTFFS